jgi:SAM-dependent methyltransferase
VSQSGGFNPGHFAPLWAAEEQHFWFRSRNDVLECIVRDEVSRLAPGYRVLEVGCGTGFVLRMLNRVCEAGSVVGLDLFHEGLVMARRRSGARLVQGRIESPPFSSPFDIVGIFDTLEHVDNDSQALEHLRALVRPGGLLVVTVPAYQHLWSDFDVEAHHCRRYEPAGLQQRLRAAGFSVEYLTPFMATLYPFARAARVIGDALRRRSDSRPSAVDEQLKIRPGLNGLLSFALAQESRLIARRRHLPVGTSLLALARLA